MLLFPLGFDMYKVRVIISYCIFISELLVIIIIIIIIITIIIIIIHFI